MICKTNEVHAIVTPLRFTGCKFKSVTIVIAEEWFSVYYSAISINVRMKPVSVLLFPSFAVSCT